MGLVPRSLQEWIRSSGWLSLRQSSGLATVIGSWAIMLVTHSDPIKAFLVPLL